MERDSAKATSRRGHLKRFLCHLFLSLAIGFVALNCIYFGVMLDAYPTSAGRATWYGLAGSVLLILAVVVLCWALHKLRGGTLSKDDTASS